MTEDRLPVRVVVVALALALLSSIAAITFLAIMELTIPDALADIPVFSGGALAGILAKTSQYERPTEPVPEDLAGE